MSKIHRTLRLQLEAANGEIERLQIAARVETQDRAHENADWRRRIHHEQNQRIAAQRGLVPYVRALEQFASWLKSVPDASVPEVINRMIALGLWDVCLGYDPDQDLSLSVASARRMDGT